MLKYNLKQFEVTPRLRLVVEQHPKALSSAAGFFVGCGSRHEDASLQGASHLAEHFFFKGTTRHSAEDISMLIERSGGDINAFTEREFTCFHTSVQRNEARLGIDILFDIVFDALLDEGDFLKEREVVVQELRGYEDNPDEEFWDSILEAPWGMHSPLGRRIGGFSKQVRKFTHKQVLSHIKKRFLSAPMVLVVVSPFEPERILKYVKDAVKRAKEMLWGDSLSWPRAPKSQRAHPPRSLAHKSSIRRFDVDQIQLGFLYPGVHLNDPQEVHWAGAAAILGAGSSSRLFRQIREESGLAYNTSVQLWSHSDAGLVMGHIVTQKKLWLEAATLASEVFKRFSETVTQNEIDFVKSMMEGTIYLNYEGTTNRMESLGRQELLMGKIFTLKHALAEVKTLSLEGVKRVGRNFEKALPCFFALGPLSQSDLKRLIKAWKGKSA